MDLVQNSEDEVVVALLNETQNMAADVNRYQNRIYDDVHNHHPHQKYSEEVNNRVKRATTSARYQERNTCSLYIQTDPLIWRHIRESIPDVSSLFSF